MNNKESKTYKDTYHFGTGFYPIAKDALPSIESDPKINTTIKKNPYKSNVEIEGDEVVLEPDMSALFKAKGKKHSGGGMDVLLKPESFVFSNDKSLALNKKDCDMFELGGNYKGKEKDKKYTPAEVLKKNIDVKHYNTLTSNLQDVKKDDLAKKSSLLMLEKYFQTLGNIAFVQEAKKGFPQGVPAFAQDTAPVYDTETKNEVNEQKQYAKYGGKINPYMQAGGYNAITKYVMPDPTKPPQNITDWMSAWGNQQPYSLTPVGPNKPFNRNATAEDRAEYMYNESQGQWYKKTYLDENRQPMEAVRPNLRGVTVGPARQKLSGVPPVESGVPRRDEAVPVPYVNYNNLNLRLNQLPVSTQGNEIFYDQVPDKVIPNNADVQVQTGKEIDWQFTPWQKLSMGYDAYKYASAKRYMPYRSRFNPSYVEPALLNPEQVVGDLKGAAYQQSQAANVLSPILRNAQQSGAYGQLLNQLPAVRSQYDNQNVGIINQARQYNNQVRNTAQGVNMKNDQQYYQESIVGQQNFDNMKSFLADRFMNNLQTNVQDNQSLALQLLAQGPNPAYSYDFRRDRFSRNPQNILDIPSNPQANVIDKLLSDLLPKFDNLDPRTQSSLIKLAGLKGLPLPTSYGFGSYKKGGKVRNPYKY